MYLFILFLSIVVICKSQLCNVTLEGVPNVSFGKNVIISKFLKF